MNLFRWANIWSIDIAVGAGLLSLVYARLWAINIPWSIPVILMIAVWLIYTFDHIKDAFDSNIKGLSQRRRLHRKYAKRLVRISIILLLIAAVLILYLPGDVVIYGTFLLCLVAAYYLALHYLNEKFGRHKEITVAFLYSIGIVLGPMALGNPPDGFMIHVFQLFLLALNNLLLFSWFDREVDEVEGFTGLAHRIPTDRFRKLLMLLAGFQVLLSLTLFLLDFYVLFELIWMMMCGAMFVPMIKPVYWFENGRYRILGDLLFFIPSLLMGLW